MMTPEIPAWLKMIVVACRTRPAWRSATLLVALVCSAAALAQENQDPEKRSKAAAAQSKEQTALVDGLLDLLEEPAVEASGTDSQKPPRQADAEVPRTEGDEPGSAADFPAEASLTSHPLSVVHRSMRSAAERLGNGVVGPDTQRLQGDILQQLDSLIEELQRQDLAQSAPQPEQPSSAAQSQASRTSNEEQSDSAQQAQPDESQPGREQQSDSGQGAQDRPSQAGGAADVAVDLADPQRLQQDVWGQLPEQMRQQMQARMVESFLPSYRPQIEAYFRKLLESESQ